MLTFKQYETIFKTAIANNGVTVVHGEVVNYEDGYQVATLRGIEMKAWNPLDLLMLMSWTAEDSFGMWYNKEEDMWYLDTSSIHIKNKAIALEEARRNKQKAIYCWATHSDIPVE